MNKEAVEIDDVQHSSSRHTRTPGAYRELNDDTNIAEQSVPTSRFNQIGGALCALIVVIDWVAISEGVCIPL